MNSLKIAENIMRLRKDKRVTQDEVASFLKVTKASVSKWENGQSMPDILLLPQLATYFDVTVDELLGYEPQLSKEQIQNIYRQLGSEFAKKSFEEVMAECETMVKRYYSCYPFLFQMCVLWINHFMLADSSERGMEILDKVQNLCDRILEKSKNVGLCNDAVMMKALVDLQCGRGQEVIDGIGELVNPYRIANQSDSMLIQAYRMTGDETQADRFAQMSMYLHLLQLVGDSGQYVGMHLAERERCEETIRRVDLIVEAYHMETIHQNVAAGYQYQTAVFYCTHGAYQEALKRLRRYAGIMSDMVECECCLRGDAYFDKLDYWFDNLDLGTQMVRDKKLVRQSARLSLDNPVFEAISDMEEFKRIFARFE